MLRSQILFVCVCRLGVCAGKKTGTLKYPSPSHLLQSLNCFSGRWELAPDTSEVGVCAVDVIGASEFKFRLLWSCFTRVCAQHPKDI